MKQFTAVRIFSIDRNLYKCYNKYNLKQSVLQGEKFS